jgi:hypothetical protein
MAILFAFVAHIREILLGCCFSLVEASIILRYFSKRPQRLILRILMQTASSQQNLHCEIVG